MAEPNSATLLTDSATASMKSTATTVKDKTPNMNSNRKKNLKQSQKSDQQAGKGTAAPSSASISKQVQDKSSTSTNKPDKPKAKPKVTDAERLGGIEKLLIQMNREVKDNRAEMSARLDKLESDYNSMDWQSDVDDMPHQGQSYYTPNPMTCMPMMSGNANDFYQQNCYQDDVSQGDSSSTTTDVHDQDESSEYDVNDNINDGSATNEQGQVTVENLLNVDNAKQDRDVKKPMGFSRAFTDEAEVGPPINQEIASEIDSMLEQKLKEVKMAELLKKYTAPSNLLRLKSQKVNAPIWSSLLPKTRSYDVRLQKVQTSLTSGMCAILHAIGDENISEKPEILNAMALFCNANYELLAARKDHIKPELNPAYAHICQKKTGKDYLFGDDLQQNVKDITEEKKAVMVCTKQGKPYYGHMKKQQRHHPYMYNARGHMQNQRFPHQKRGHTRSFLGNRGPSQHPPFQQQMQYQQYPQYQNMPQQNLKFNRGGKAPSTLTRPSQ